MTDIVKFFKEVVDYLNNNPTEGCGGCFYYGAPLTQSAKELQQVPDESCDCTFMFVTRYEYSIQDSVNPRTTILTDRFVSHSVTLEVVKHDKIGKNNYSEIEDYPISESRWETIFKPIQQCMSRDNMFFFCEVLGKTMQITAFSARMQILSTSNEYSGWVYNINLRERLI